MTIRCSCPALAALAGLAFSAGAQDTARVRADVSSQFTVTNNGMSTIPAFTLGKPAALVYLFVRRGAWSFEPEFRSGLDGRPWAVIVWGRYRIVRERFSLGLSAHPAINFRSTTVTVNGATRDVMVARRYLVAELTPTYAMSPRLSAGVAYLYNRALEHDVPASTHFIAARSTVGVPLAAGYTLRVAPQAYYLRMGVRGGTYMYSATTLARRRLPLSLSSAINWPLHTTVPPNGNVTWNVSANYVIQ